MDVPIDFVAARQMAVRGFAFPAVLDIDFMGQKSHHPDGCGHEILDAVRWQTLAVAPANVHIIRLSRYVSAILVGVKRNGSRVRGISGWAAH